MPRRSGSSVQLDYTNTRLREILADLLALPEDKRPIIIFQADEGPESDDLPGDPQDDVRLGERDRRRASRSSTGS